MSAPELTDPVIRLVTIPNELQSASAIGDQRLKRLQSTRRSLRLVQGVPRLLASLYRHLRHANNLSLTVRVIVFEVSHFEALLVFRVKKIPTYILFRL